MKHLLLLPTFDQFELISGEIITFNTFTINGYRQKEFFHTGEDASLSTNVEQDYSNWSELKAYCLELIKGKRSPLGFKFILRLNPQNTLELAESIEEADQIDSFPSLLLNIRFDGNHISCVSGTNHEHFTMDKTWEQAWDKKIGLFLEELEDQ